MYIYKTHLFSFFLIPLLHLVLLLHPFMLNYFVGILISTDTNSVAANCCSSEMLHCHSRQAMQPDQPLPLSLETHKQPHITCV